MRFTIAWTLCCHGQIQHGAFQDQSLIEVPKSRVQIKAWTEGSTRPGSKWGHLTAQALLIYWSIRLM